MSYLCSDSHFGLSHFVDVTLIKMLASQVILKIRLIAAPSHSFYATVSLSISVARRKSTSISPEFVGLFSASKAALENNANTVAFSIIQL